MELGNKIPLSRTKSYYAWAGLLLVGLAAVLTGYKTRFDPLEAVKVLPGVATFIWMDFLPPAGQAVPGFIGLLLDTVYMAVISTMAGTAISLVLALLGANLTTPHPCIKLAIRAFASLLRNIPSLAWTIILVPAFGIGKAVGLMALTINAIGTLTRLFTETIEEIDTSGLEAIRAAGGSYWPAIKNGVLPQCSPGLISWSLYNFELDIRASTVIGMVGGGGIGFFIQSNIKLFRYDYATTAIIAVALVVLFIEWVSKKVRERIM